MTSCISSIKPEGDVSLFVLQSYCQIRRYPRPPTPPSPSNTRIHKPDTVWTDIFTFLQDFAYPLTTENTVLLTLCYYLDTYPFQSKSTFYSRLYVKELLAQNNGI